MPRSARVAPGGWVFHVLNRRTGAELLFDSAASYREFLEIVGKTAVDENMRLLAYCAMPTHWHMLLWPRQDGDLARFVHRFCGQHAKRWHLRHETVGRGHLYQARYKSFPVHTDTHLLTVCRYIERNPLRAGLVESAERWPWSSAAARIHQYRSGDADRRWRIKLEPLPVEPPTDWSRWLDEPHTAQELDELRSSVQRGIPYGDSRWQAQAAAALGLKATLRRPGRQPRQRMLLQD